LGKAEPQLKILRFHPYLCQAVPDNQFQPSLQFRFHLYPHLKRLKLRFSVKLMHC